MRRFLINGYSNHTGFILNINGLILKTSNFKKGDFISYFKTENPEIFLKLYNLSLKIISWGYITGVIFMCFLLFGVRLLNILELRGFISFVIGWILFLIFWKLFLKVFVFYLLAISILDSETKRWHAAEHRVYKFIQKEFLDIKNLDIKRYLLSIYSFSWGCGTVRVLIFLSYILLLLFCSLLFFFKIKIDIIFLNSFLLFYCIFEILFIIGFQYLTLKKPTDEIINEAVKVVENYYKFKNQANLGGSDEDNQGFIFEDYGFVFFGGLSA